MRSTKNRIADTALCLFNQVGTDGVSTNHIAAAMEISPGNLYYHYANKDEILLVLLDRLGCGLEDVWAATGESPGEDSLRAAVAGTFALLDRHRYFARELFALAHRSPALRERTRSLSERCVRAIERRMVSSSGTWRRALDRACSGSLAWALWLSILEYVGSAELCQLSAEPAAWSHGVDFALGLLEPHLQAERNSGVNWIGGLAVGFTAGSVPGLP
jgi:AcrR family transcriptional regulator